MSAAAPVALVEGAVRDQTASWGGPVVALIAVVIFVGFAVWIVVQRIRGGRHVDPPADEATRPEPDTDDRERVDR